MANELQLIRIDVVNVGSSGVVADSPASEETQMAKGATSEAPKASTSTANDSNQYKTFKNVGKASALAGVATVSKNVGTFTGNQALQNKVDIGMQVGAVAAAAAINPALAVASMAYTIANNAIKIAEKIQYDAANTQLSSQRLGVVLTGSNRNTYGR